MLVLLMDKTFKTALAGVENHTTAPLAQGNAPLLPPAAASPPEGEILAALCLELLASLEAERRANFPLRGKWWRQPPIGVHFRERSEVCLFPFVETLQRVSKSGKVGP